MKATLLGLACVLAAAAPALAAAAPPRFVEETASSGITQRYDGDWEFFVGGGVAVFDCDGDGRSDLYFAGGAGPSALYRNTSRRGGPLRFEPVTGGAATLRAATGAYPLNVDGDDFTDLIVLRVGTNVALRGRGDCRFERANELWNFAGGDAWSTGLSARWLAGQEWPTIAIGNYVDRDAPGAPWGTCADNSLQRPAPKGRGFAASIALSPGYCSLSVLFSDWDRSGGAALRVANDRHYYRGGEEQLWRIPARGAATLYTRTDGWQRLVVWGMGIASYDLTGDGYPEYAVTSMGDTKIQTLAAGHGRPTYGDIAFMRGMTAHRPFVGGDTRPSTGWHADFQDVNNDGLIDLFIAKGNVRDMPDAAQRDPNSLLIGQADGTFIEGAVAAGVVSYARGRGAALADFNLDGALDLVVVNQGAAVQIWRNTGREDGGQAARTGHWVAVRLRQAGGNRDAIGAWLELEAAGRIQRREITLGGGHAGDALGWRHFGLGNAARARLRVIWPGGETGAWMALAANNFFVIDRALGEALAWVPRD